MPNPTRWWRSSKRGNRLAFWWPLETGTTTAPTLEYKQRWVNQFNFYLNDAHWGPFVKLGKYGRTNPLSSSPDQGERRAAEAAANAAA